MKGGAIIVSPRVGAVLVCGIIILFAACMNYRESAGMSMGTDLILLAAVLIFTTAGVLYVNEQQ